MNIKNRVLTTLLVSIVFIITSCVTSKQYKDTKSKADKCEEEKAQLKKQLEALTASSNEQNSKISALQQKMLHLQSDSAMNYNRLNEVEKKYKETKSAYDLLSSKNKELLKGNEDENKRLMGHYQGSMEELQKKQDDLKKLEKELDAQKKSLDQTQIELNKTREDLKAREARVAELEGILRQKDKAVADLKKKVSDALVGFEGKGLTVTQKNGKIYVSLDESLLFASGSIKVEDKGVEPLKKLAKVLEQNTDINIMIEGHTDDVPMIGKGEIKDNWDLSVMRATSIVKIITSNSNVAPKRLTAAGRGEYYPLDGAKTAEARKKNRRTEIILTPKLDELLKILE